GPANINFTSLDKEIELGRQLAAEIEKQVTLVDDATVNEYVNGVTQNLARHSDAKVPVVIKVVDAAEINAAALPGGFIYLNKGVLRAANKEAERAAAIAHAIAHVPARHGTENAAKGTFLNIGTIPQINQSTRAPGTGIRQAAGLGQVNGFLRFSRKDVVE